MENSELKSAFTHIKKIPPAKYLNLQEYRHVEREAAIRCGSCLSGNS